jgi:hypothetical protein
MSSYQIAKRVISGSDAESTLLLVEGHSRRERLLRPCKIVGCCRLAAYYETAV